MPLLQKTLALTDSIIELFTDVPVRPRLLDALLANDPAIVEPLSEPARTAGSSDIVRWHLWHDDFNFLNCPYAQAIALPRPNLAGLCTTSVVDRWTCDIQDVEMLSSSKSSLSAYDSLDAMAKARAPEWIETIDQASLTAMLAWKEIRIIHRDRTSDHFQRFGWDGRVGLSNSGGSHHFVAARYLARRLCQPVPLTGTLMMYDISADAVATLRHSYNLLALALTDNTLIDLFEALEHWRAPYAKAAMPAPYRHWMYLFPRDHPRSTMIADRLRIAGAVDLGKRLAQLATAP